MIAMQFVYMLTHVTWCRTNHDSLTGCIPGRWSCPCPYCTYGDVLIIYICYVQTPPLATTRLGWTKNTSVPYDPADPRAPLATFGPYMATAT